MLLQEVGLGLRQAAARQVQAAGCARAWAWRFVGRLVLQCCTGRSCWRLPVPGWGACPAGAPAVPASWLEATCSSASQGTALGATAAAITCAMLLYAFAGCVVLVQRRAVSAQYDAKQRYRSSARTAIVAVRFKIGLRTSLWRVWAGVRTNRQELDLYVAIPLLVAALLHWRCSINARNRPGPRCGCKE